MVKPYFNLAWRDVAIVLVAFFIIDLILSYLLARFCTNSGANL